MIDRKYLDIIEEIIFDGEDVETRNAKVRKVFQVSRRYTTTPLVSVRKTAWKQALREMEWFLSGSNNINDLHESVKHWWSPWANERGEIPNNYGEQFIAFCGFESSINQIDYLIETLKTNPQSRRGVITTWNTADMVDANTPITNCHGSIIQTNVNSNANTLDLFMYQRSADVMLGVPHNTIQYWAFLLYLCNKTGYKPGTFFHTLGNAHIYESHLKVAHLCTLTPISNITTPELEYNPTSDKFKADDFTLVGNYKPLIDEKLELII